MHGVHGWMDGWMYGSEHEEDAAIKSGIKS